MEGAELAVLRGAGRVLAGSPALICEVSAPNTAAVSGILTGHGYALYDGDQVRGELVPAATAPFNTLAVTAPSRLPAPRREPSVTV